jgi:hypothetical protein
MRLVTFWVASSAILLASCANIKRPDADLCVVNAPGKKLTCYNLEKDYNDDGQIKPGIQPHFKPATDLDALNKHVAMSAADFAKFKAYIKKLREEYESGCK